MLLAKSVVKIYPGVAEIGKVSAGEYFCVVGLMNCFPITLQYTCQINPFSISCMVRLRNSTGHNYNHTLLIAINGNSECCSPLTPKDWEKQVVHGTECET